MQTLAGQSRNSSSKQSRKIAVFAILLFALSGLISGFAVGAFVRPGQRQTFNPGSGNTPVVQITKTPEITRTASPTKLGWPVVIQSPNSRQIANGTTTYTITIQVVDQSIDPGHGYPVKVSGISCKIWLTKESKVNDIIQADNDARLKSVDTLNEPFPGEMVGSFIFDPGTPQTQPSDANGQATWKYTVAPSAGPGDYNLVVLADWNGKHYNWMWLRVTIKQGN